MSQSDKSLFDSISEQYVQKDLRFSSRLARMHRLKQTLTLVPARSTKPRILEVGCGAGFSATYLKEFYAQYVGIDYSAELIDLARRYNNATGVEFVCADLTDLRTVERFDIVLMIGVLHHLPDPAKALSDLGRLLAPDGTVVVNEPQNVNPIISWLRFLRKTFDSSYSRTQREFSTSELRSLFSASGLVDVNLCAQGMFSTPLAEISFRPDAIFSPIAKIACSLDSWLERHMPRLMLRLSWNVVVIGRPDAPSKIQSGYR